MSLRVRCQGCLGGRPMECLGGRSCGKRLAGARAPGSFERPSRAYVPRRIAARQGNTTEHGSLGSLPDARPDPVGESAPGYGKRPDRRPVGGSAAGRFSLPAPSSSPLLPLPRLQNAESPRTPRSVRSAVRGAKAVGRRGRALRAVRVRVPAVRSPAVRGPDQRPRHEVRVSGPRPGRSRAGPRRCRSGAGGRCGNPAP